MGTGEAAQRLDATFEALSDPLRRRTIELLSANPSASGELARRLGVTRSTMSKHLRVLRRSGLVAERSDDLDARVRIYSLRSAAMSDLRAWLARTETAWVDQLSALADHLGDPDDAHRPGEGESGP